MKKNYSSVSLSQIVSSNRMDAKFHVTVDKLNKSGLVANINENCSREEVLVFLDSVPCRIKAKAAIPFVRGQDSSTLNVDKAINEYSVLVAANCFSEQAPQKVLKNEINELKVKLSKLDNFAKKIGK